MKNTVQASLITTYRCNAQCHMCNIWQHPTQTSEELEVKYYEKIPEGLRINITGGEPMLREDIGEIFKILYPKAQLLELSTNGFYTDKIVRIAEKYPDILIRVSLEGLPRLNDSLRGTQDGFDHALRTILELKKTKCRNIGFSIVISSENARDLVHLYEVCASLGVELGNSVMHNSWYFKKHDNRISGNNDTWRYEADFIKALLKSKRHGIKGKLKDFARAYFNLSIMKRLRGDPSGYRPACGAGKDFFFVDPRGNVTPCNGSEEQWIIGNIKEKSVDDILNSVKAREISEKAKACTRECCFVVTERHDMLRNPLKPIAWILKNKMKLAFDIPVEL